MEVEQMAGATGVAGLDRLHELVSAGTIWCHCFLVDAA